MREALEKAQKTLETQYELLNSLPGYQKLTERQKNIIRGWLAMQQWSELPTKNAVIDAYMNNMYCHTTIATLEDTKIDRRMPPRRTPLSKFPTSFFEVDSGYHQFESYVQVEAFVEKAGSPCVVLLVDKKPETGEDVTDPKRWKVWHSCLALGRDISGVLWVGDKRNLREPYRLHPLRTVFEQYLAVSRPNPDGKSLPSVLWGTRPLRKQEGETELAGSS